MVWSRVGLVVVAALAAAGLPVLAGWAAVRAPAPPSGEPAGELPLLLALGAAPVVALLGAVGGAAWLRASRRLAASPLVAALAALATLGGMLTGVYLHLIFRARLAGAPGLPPFALLFRVGDFARAIPLVPVGLLLGGVLGSEVARRGLAAGLAASVALGIVLALGAGVATLLPVAIAALLGNGAMFGLFGGLVLVVAGLAGRSRPTPNTR